MGFDDLTAGAVRVTPPPARQGDPVDSGGGFSGLVSGGGRRGLIFRGPGGLVLVCLPRLP